MLDTIHIQLINKDLGNIPELLGFNPVKNPYNKGKYENFRIRVYKSFDNYNILLEGSLHKYFKGNNSCDFSFNDIKRSIFKLGEDLGIDITKGVVRRLDIGANIELKYNPRFYNLCLYSGYRFTKNFINDGETVDFRKGKISLCFYDKVEESKSELFKYSTSSNSKYKNVIRYEIRLIKTLAKTLKLQKSKLLVSDLYRKKIQRKLIKLWSREYRHLTKISLKGLYPEDFRTFKEYMYAHGLIAIGSKDIITLIKAWSNTKGLEYHRFRYLKESTKKIFSTFDASNKLTLELDQKIRKVKKHVLSSI